MKKLLILALMVVLVPATGMAMKAMDNKDMKMDKGSMEKSGMSGVVMLQDEVVDGVKGAAHLMDAKDGKGQMLMVMFTDEKTGAMISEGRCAVKIESPDEKLGEAQKMMTHDGMFGTSVSFTQKGMHHLNVGTKLADGKKRAFHFHYEN
ncbi:hypothetical protein [Geopsychrobacter electrodiphilus]|uniref:hypothetical protein n=1 Tax=Geopsychrobacter electrodiphilus TaxID=225196 RepID=UPI0003724446|nr:hypothetical protein [Geopsychrobacter electrodiphilus]